MKMEPLQKKKKKSMVKLIFTEGGEMCPKALSSVEIMLVSHLHPQWAIDQGFLFHGAVINSASKAYYFYKLIQKSYQNYTPYLSFYNKLSCLHILEVWSLTLISNELLFLSLLSFPEQFNHKSNK